MKRSVAVLIALAVAGWAGSARANIIGAGAFSVSGADTGYISNNGGATYIDCFESATFGLQTFCTAPNTGSQISHDYSAVSCPNAASAMLNWASASQASQNATWLYNQYFVGKSGLTADQVAGIQLAIGKVLLDTGANGQASGNFASGQYRAFDFGGLAYATQLITALDAARANGSFNTVAEQWLHGGAGSQKEYLPTPTPVPEPGAILAAVSLLALPLGASVTRILKRKRQG